MSKIKKKKYSPLVDEGFGLIHDGVPMDGTLPVTPLSLPGLLEFSSITTGETFGAGGDTKVRIQITGVSNASIVPGTYLYFTDELVTALNAETAFTWVTEGWYLVIPVPAGYGGLVGPQDVFLEMSDCPGAIANAGFITAIAMGAASFLGDPVRGNVNIIAQPNTLPEYGDLSYITKGLFEESLTLLPENGCNLTYSVVDGTLGYIADDMTGATVIAPGDWETGGGGDDEFHRVSLAPIVAFPFYNELKDTDIFIYSNGYVAFTNQYLYDDYDQLGPIPNSVNPQGGIYGWQIDCDPSSGGTVQYKFFGTYMVVEFINVPHYSAGGNNINFKIRLFGVNSLSTPGRVEIWSSAIGTPPGEFVVQGIENSVGSLGTGSPGLNYVDVPLGGGGKLDTNYIFDPVPIEVNTIEVVPRPNDCHTPCDVVTVDKTGRYTGVNAHTFQHLDEYGSYLVSHLLLKTESNLIKRADFTSFPAELQEDDIDAENATFTINGLGLQYQFTLASFANTFSVNVGDTIRVCGAIDKIDGYRRVLVAPISGQDATSMVLSTELYTPSGLISEVPSRIFDTLNLEHVVFGRLINGKGVTGALPDADTRVDPGSPYTFNINLFNHGLVTGDDIQISRWDFEYTDYQGENPSNYSIIPGVFGGFYKVTVIDFSNFSIELTEPFMTWSYNQLGVPVDPTFIYKNIIVSKIIHQPVYGNLNLLAQPNTLPNFNDLSLITKGILDAAVSGAGAKNDLICFTTTNDIGKQIQMAGPPTGNRFVAQFEFKGTTILGTPTSMSLVADANNPVPHTISIYDITNAQQIGVYGKSTAGQEIVQFNALTNLPTTPAIFELRVSKSAGGSLNVEYASLSINY
jgi:hypothetical protein